MARSRSRPTYAAGRVDIETLQLQHDRKVRRFLKFQRKDAGAYGVGSPGGDEDGVARLDREPVQQTEQRRRVLCATRRRASGCSTSRCQPT